MTSQLNVDTIVDKAGSGGTNVKIANTSVTVAEGGSATTTTVQGLAKVWNHYDQNTGNDIRDSFNVSSVTDSATGKMQTIFTNVMNNNFYSVSATVEDGGYGGIGFIGTSGDPVNDANEMQTNLIQIQVRNNNGATPSTFDPDCAMIQVLGDLA
jgi:hypothetical protein